MYGGFRSDHIKLYTTKDDENHEGKKYVNKIKMGKGNFSFDCIITTYKYELFPTPCRCSSMRANFYMWSLLTQTHGRTTMYKMVFTQLQLEIHVICFNVHETNGLE